MNTLAKKNIVITGASSGIGRQIAIEASKYDANIILIARNQERLHETLTRMNQGNHLVFSLDITNYSELDAVINLSVQKLGKISGFVHSAGIKFIIPFRNMKPEYYQQLFNINVISGFEFARIISKKNYISESGGSFVFLSSVMGKLGKEGIVGYCASKAALTSSVKAMALELASKKVRCNVVLPGIVKTEMLKETFDSIPEDSYNELIKDYPLGFGEPIDIDNLVLFLLSDNSKWITGTEIIIDGGYSAK